MNRIPHSRADFHRMTRGDLARIYRAARSHAVAREGGLTPTAFDKDMERWAEQAIATGWTRAAAMTSAALCDYLGAHDTHHRHESPETREWSSMEATVFTTTERHPQAYQAIFEG